MTPKNLYMRWLALLAILANIAFNALYTAVAPGGATIAQITYQYSSLFTPAGYAFSIWGIIYLSFIVYGIAQLVPKVKHNVTYNKLALPMVLTNVLSIVWIMAFTANNIAGSVMLMGGMLVLGGYMFLQAQKCYKAGWAPGLLLVPFSLFLG
jgi:translocator protein